MKTKQLDWKRSKKGNLYRWTRHGMIVVFERSDGKGHGIMRTGHEDGPTFYRSTFGTEEEALEAAPGFIDDLRNTAEPW
jgi:hypothetical protein